MLNSQQYIKQPSTTKNDLVQMSVEPRLGDPMFVILPQPLGYELPEASSSVLFVFMSLASSTKPAHL